MLIIPDEILMWGEILFIDQRPCLEHLLMEFRQD